MKPQINGNRDPSSVAVSCSKNQGGLGRGGRFHPPPPVSLKPEFCVKNQAESRNGRRRRELRVDRAWFPKSAPARFGCKQRKACSNTGVGYGGAASARSGGAPVCTVRAELACLSLSACRSGALWLAKGPFFFDFDVCLRIPTHFGITSTDEVAWPQGDQILGGGLVAQGQGRTSERGKHTH